VTWPSHSQRLAVSSAATKGTGRDRTDPKQCREPLDHRIARDELLKPRVSHCDLVIEDFDHTAERRESVVFIAGGISRAKLAVLARLKGVRNGRK
jgi:hypothetical protein